MSRIIRTFAAVLITMLCAVSLCYGASAQIVSPSANNVIYSDSVLISVKVTEKETVKIEMLQVLEETAPETYLTATDGAITTVPAIYSPLSSAGVSSADLAKIADGTRQTEDGTPVLLSDGDQVGVYKDKSYMSPVDYTNEAEVGFYTKQVQDVTPGVYKVQVSCGEEQTSTLVAVNKKKPAEQKTSIFTNQSSGTVKYIQTFLKSLFR